MGVLKYHYPTKRTRELLIGNSRFLIQNQLLCYTDVKESYLFVGKIVEALDLNNVERPYDLATVFSRLDRFKNQEGNILKAACRELYFKR